MLRAPRRLYGHLSINVPALAARFPAKPRPNIKVWNKDFHGSLFRGAVHVWRLGWFLNQGGLGFGYTRLPSGGGRRASPAPRSAGAASPAPARTRTAGRGCPGAQAALGSPKPPESCLGAGQAPKAPSPRSGWSLPLWRGQSETGEHALCHHFWNKTRKGSELPQTHIVPGGGRCSVSLWAVPMGMRSSWCSMSPVSMGTASSRAACGDGVFSWCFQAAWESSGTNCRLLGQY